MTITSQFADIRSSSNFIDVVLFLLSSLFNDQIFMSTSSLVLELWQFSFISDWPEIRNTFVWVLPNKWKLGQVRNTKFATNISNKMLLNAAKFQGYSFYCFWVIKGKPIGIFKNYLSVIASKTGLLRVFYIQRENLRCSTHVMFIKLAPKKWGNAKIVTHFKTDCLRFLNYFLAHYLLRLAIFSFEVLLSLCSNEMLLNLKVH